MSSSEHKITLMSPLQYAEEVLCANWNPLALLVAEPAPGVRPSVLDGSDAEAFLARLYRCQQA
jgi:hypothetical protein